MIVLYALLAVFGAFLLVRSAIAGANALRNRRIETAARSCIGDDGLWHGQARPPLGELRFGYYSVARSGCGAIAAANVLARLGRPMPLWRVIAACEWGTLFLGAKVGLNPLCLLPILAVLCRRAQLQVRLRGRLLPPERLPAGGVVVLTHLNGAALRDGAHTVTVYAAEDGGIRVANVLNHAAAAGRYASIAAYLRDRRMLFAIVIEAV